MEYKKQPVETEKPHPAKLGISEYPLELKTLDGTDSIVVDNQSQELKARADGYTEKGDSNWTKYHRGEDHVEGDKK